MTQRDVPSLRQLLEAVRGRPYAEEALAHARSEAAKIVDDMAASIVDTALKMVECELREQFAAEFPGENVPLEVFLEELRKTAAHYRAAHRR